MKLQRSRLMPVSAQATVTVSLKLQRSRLMPVRAPKMFNYESYECELYVLVGIMICDDYDVIMNS